MKTVILIRHAKSSWDDPRQPDFERTLNDRGRKNAAEMAIRLAQKIPVIDLFISSPAKRARKTAEYFVHEYKAGPQKLQLLPELYHASPDNFMATISGLDEQFNTVALFSHNPGITYFINQLTQVQIDHLPTCGIFAFETQLSSWTDFASAEKDFLFFDYPKASEDKD